MRIKNSSYNVIFDIIQLIITSILTFVTRTYFIRFLGSEMLGLDGLFTNVLSMLSLTELGFSTAICFSLYKPLATNDKEQVAKIMALLKKAFRIIALIIFVIGLLIIPIIPLISNGYNSGNLYLYYILYLINTVISYLLTYKETLIIADQKAHRISVIRTIFITILYTSQIILLNITKNFTVYLIAMIVINFIKDITINIYITKKYKDVDFNTKLEVDKKTKKEIFNNTKNLFISRVGDYLLNGTDNIIISIINITLTGIYSNYLSITGIMKTVINSIYNGVTASIGNVMAIEKLEVQERIFNISCFISFFVAGFITIEMIFLFNPVITIWASIGKWTGVNYVLPFWMSIVIALNFYFYAQTRPLSSLKIASGKYKADRFIPLAQAIVNLVVSVVLGFKIGLGGVILGTLVSYILVGCVFRPLVLIKNIFGKSSSYYFYKQLKHLIVLSLLFLINLLMFKYIALDSSIILIIIKGFVIMFIFLIITYIFYHNDESYQFIFDLFKKILWRKHENN